MFISAQSLLIIGSLIFGALAIPYQEGPTSKPLNCESAEYFINTMVCDRYLSSKARHSLIAELRKTGRSCTIWLKGGLGPQWKAEGDLIECPRKTLKLTADCDEITCTNVIVDSELTDGAGL
jgi:hypothetical protein